MIIRNTSALISLSLMVSSVLSMEPIDQNQPSNTDKISTHEENIDPEKDITSIKKIELSNLPEYQIGKSLRRNMNASTVIDQDRFNALQDLAEARDQINSPLEKLKRDLENQFPKTLGIS